MEELGIARGYIELDLTSMETSVASATKELDKIERAGKLAQSGINKLESISKGTGNAFQDAATKAKTLNTNIEQAKSKCSVYKKEIEGLNTILERSKEKQKGLASEIEKAKEKTQQADEKVKSLSDAYKDAQKEIKSVTDEYGKNSQQAQAVTEKNKDIIDSYEKAEEKSKKYRNELLQLQNQYDSYGAEIENSSAKIQEFQADLNNTETDIYNMRMEMEKAQSNAILWGDSMKQSGEKMQALGDKIGKVGTALTLGVTTPIVAAGTYAVKSAIDFESAFTGVTKTVDGTTTQLNTLRQGIIDMSKEIPSSTTEISAVAEAAGQLGIQTDNVLEFTRTMIDLGNSTNLSAEEAASALAKFANVTGMSQSDFDKLGSTIVDLGNNFATTEVDIVNMATRLSGAGAQVGLTEGEIMGFATALSSVGIEAEMGGSAFSKAMVKMQVACETGLTPVQTISEQTGLSLRELELLSANNSKAFAELAGSLGLTKDELQSMVTAGSNLESFAEVAGMTADEFKQAFETDAAGAIEKFIQGLGDTEGKGESTIAMLEEMGFTEVRLRDTMTRLANSGDLVTSAVDMGNKAWEENNALTNEAEKRYGTTESKLEITKNKITDTARVMGEKLLPIVADVVEDIGELVEKFSDLSPEQQKAIIKTAGFAAALGPVTKVAGTAVKGIGSLSKGIGGLMEKAGKKSALKTLSDGVADITQKSGDASGAVGGFSGIVSKLGGPLGIAAIAATAVIGIGTAFVIAKEKAKEANLKEHFGDVKLSAEEVEDVAKRLTTTDWTVKVTAAVDAKEELETLQSDLETTINDMNKAAWKVSVGLELSTEEQESYKDSVLTYVQQVQDYVEQQRYTATLAIDALLEPGTASYSNLSNFTSEFYSGTSKELQALGDELAQAVNDAWADGILDDDEFELIEEKRKQIQEYMDKIADAEYEASLGRIVANAPKSGIDAESFQKLQDEIHDQIQERLDEADQTYDTVVAKLNMEYPNGGEDYERLLADVNRQFYDKQGEIHLGAINAEIDTIQGNYEKVADEAADNFAKNVSDTFESRLEQYPTDFNGFYNALESDFTLGAANLDGATKGAIEKLLKNMEPDINELESIAQQYRDIGEIPPENIADGLLDYYKLSAMTGNMDAAYKVLADQVANSPELQTAITNAIEGGQQIPVELADALKDNYGIVFDAETGMMEQVLKAAETSYPTIEEAMKALGMSLPENLAGAINVLSPDVYDEVLGMLNEMANGVSLTQPQLEKLFNDLGVSSSNHLIQSLEGKESELQAEAITLLSQLQEADDAKRPEILSQLHQLGIDLDDSIEQGLNDNVSSVEGGAKNSISAADNVTKNSTLTAPKLGKIDGATPAAEAVNDAQSYLNRVSLSATLNIFANRVSNASKHADGGFVNQEQLSWLAEGNNPEVVIPLSSAKRSRALSLYEQTGAALGVNDSSAAMRASIFDGFTTSDMLKNNRIYVQAPAIDTMALAKEIASLLQINPEVNIEMKDGDVYMDSEKVGKKVAPVVSRVQAKKL